MNIANKLTILRILMIPLFMFVLESGNNAWFFWLSFRDAQFLATIIFVLASFTDFLDGFLARKLNLITDFGKLMDPLADKILVMTALIYLVTYGLIPAWVVIIIFAREFIISGIRMVAASYNIVIAASVWGKLKTVSQMSMIVVLLLSFGASAGFLLFGDILVYLSAGLTIISLIEYIFANRQVFKKI